MTLYCSTCCWVNDSDSLVATCWRNEGTHRLLKEAEILNQSFCGQLQDLIHWDEYFGVCIVVPGVNPGLPGLRNQTSPLLIKTFPKLAQLFGISLWGWLSFFNKSKKYIFIWFNWLACTPQSSLYYISFFIHLFYGHVWCLSMQKLK